MSSFPVYLDSQKFSPHGGDLQSCHYGRSRPPVKFKILPFHGILNLRKSHKKSASPVKWLKTQQIKNQQGEGGMNETTHPPLPGR